jgi:hypothetical protein
MLAGRYDVRVANSISLGLESGRGSRPAFADRDGQHRNLRANLPLVPVTFPDSRSPG